MRCSMPFTSNVIFICVKHFRGKLAQNLLSASRHLKRTAQGFQLLLGLVMLLRLLLLLLLHPLGDVGVQRDFLWTWGGGRSGDFP